MAKSTPPYDRPYDPAYAPPIDPSLEPRRRARVTQSASEASVAADVTGKTTGETSGPSSADASPAPGRPPGSRRRRGRQRPAPESELPFRYTMRDAEPAEVEAARTGTLPPPPPPVWDGSFPGEAPHTLSVDLDDGRIDPDAAKVVRRLARHGYEAYLVGGCVRDLLLGRQPKDFDVATSARPEAVRALFRNSRIIGRRFRLVHVIFGANKVIETATFRRAPELLALGTDGLIRSDNEFGEAHEDAERRDFTINALFYDLERRMVLDWVGGLPDIEQRMVRTIGDPLVRFREDPVRILRAIKFSARLDLGIAPEVYDAMVQCRELLSRSARPRLFEETLRLLRSGAAQRSIWLASETGVLDVLLPELSAYLLDRPEDDRATWHLLRAVDRRHREREQPLDDIVLFTALLLEPHREACDGARDRLGAAYEMLEPIIERLNVPRRIADNLRRVVAMLPRVEDGRPGRFSRTAAYPLACEVLELVQDSRELSAELGNRPLALAPAEEDDKPRRRRKRRKSSPNAEPPHAEVP